MQGDGLSSTDRRALTAVAAQFFVNGMMFASFVPRLPEIRDRIDIDNDTLGRLLAIGALAGVLGSLAVGRLVERFGTRRLLTVAGVALCGSLTIIGIATVPAMLVIGLALMSIFDVLVDSAMNLQGSWISARRTAPVMNRLHGLWSLGTVVGGIGAAQVAGLGVSLQTHLFVVAGTLLLVVLAVGAGLLRVDEHGAEADQPAAAARSIRLSRPLILLGVLGSCSIVMEVTASDWAAIRLTDDFDASAGVSGFAYVAFTVGMTAGRFGGDSMVVLLGHRRLADVGIGLAFAGLAAASLAPNQWIVMAGYAVAGLGIATQFPKLYDDAAKYPGRPGAGLGALTGGSRIALLVTPVVVGALADTQLSVGTAIALVTLPAAFAFAALTRTRQREV